MRVDFKLVSICQTRFDIVVTQDYGCCCDDSWKGSIRDTSEWQMVYE